MKKSDIVLLSRRYLYESWPQDFVLTIRACSYIVTSDRAMRAGPRPTVQTLECSPSSSYNHLIIPFDQLQDLFGKLIASRRFCSQ